MHHRRSSIAAGALLLAAVPALASCGFDYATDRVNTISAGTNDRSGEVDVLGAVVVAKQPDAGVFTATLVNNSETETDSLVGLSGDDDGIAVAGDPGTIELAPQDRVNLLDQQGIPITGTFGAGDFVSVTLNFESGQTSTIQVNVVRPCFQYSPLKFPDLAFPEPAPADPSDTTSEDSNPRVGGTEAAYSCEPAESTVAPNGKAPDEGEGEENSEDLGGDEVPDTGGQE